MDDFFDRLVIRTATFDELLSSDFEALPGQKGDSDVAALRLAAWCRASASGDWRLFKQRIERDRLDLLDILSKFANVQRKHSSRPPAWLDDARWIMNALESPCENFPNAGDGSATPFEHLLSSVVVEADNRLWDELNPEIQERLTQQGRADLRQLLLEQLCDLTAPALFDLFQKAGHSPLTPSIKVACGKGDKGYRAFVTHMKACGLRRLFEKKPVMLRLIAITTRNWIDATRDLVVRLKNDHCALARTFLSGKTNTRVDNVVGGLSDPHNHGRSVLLLTFTDGIKIVYKPKDLGIDVSFVNLVAKFNAADPPVDLRAARCLARDGYGWSEFIAHVGCSKPADFDRFFYRAGAWLALFHVFASADMHQENLIACADYPVPIDLEMALQGSFDNTSPADINEQAFEIALQKVTNSISTIGIVRAYVTRPESLGKGGKKSHGSKFQWQNVNTDAMYPCRRHNDPITTHIPYVNDTRGEFLAHIETFVSGFEAYSKFILSFTASNNKNIVSDLNGKATRRVFLPTRFYYGLIERLRDYRSMNDGITWSVQTDFLSRLVDWDQDIDRLWPLQKAQRKALVDLNIPYFCTQSDARTLFDIDGPVLELEETPGAARAEARVNALSVDDVAWQSDVIRQEASLLSNYGRELLADRVITSFASTPLGAASKQDLLVAETNKIADELSQLAIRSFGGAAWIGVDRLRDSEAIQLIPLSDSLYAGVTGVALFFAAYAKFTGRHDSEAMARAAIIGLKRKLRSRNAPRMARFMGTGGVTGIGSIVYALVSISHCLRDEELIDEALVAARLLTHDLIFADKALTLIDGNAGAILTLLKLYRETGEREVLKRAVLCGEHLLRQRRIGKPGCRSWPTDASGSIALNGMSHGSAGFAYALAALFHVTSREDFRVAAEESLALENTTFSVGQSNWPDLTGEVPTWPAQWCHGAAGIGLARCAIKELGFQTSAIDIDKDIYRSLEGIERKWPSALDTLCCGTLGAIELLDAAGRVLESDKFNRLASERLVSVIRAASSRGDYRWNGGARRFNLGLFRGLSGIGYTILRHLDKSLPDVLTLR